MSAALAYETAPALTAQRGGLASTAPKMSLYDLQNRYYQLHAECSFSAAESHLYFYLLHQFNAARWPARLYRKRNQLAADLSIDGKTLDNARARLEGRGLLTYVAGNKVQSASWSLADASQMDGKNSPQSGDCSQMDGNFSAPSGNNPPKASQMDGKNSPPYKEEEKTTKEEDKTAAAAAGGRPEKKTGAASSSTARQRPASHTRGAARQPPPAPAELLPDACPLADLLNPPGDAHRVQLVPEPLTAAQAERLLHDYAEPAVRDILCQMANWQLLLTKCHSVNLTARNWLNKRAKEASTRQPAPDATANRPYPPQRPVNGHKPAGDGGSLARLLAESD